MYIQGVVLPQGKNLIENPIDEFTPDEVRDMKLTGMPLWVDHKEGTEVGEIVHDFVGTDGMKYVIGHVRGDTLYEKLTQYRIKNKALPDFSLTHKFTVYENEKTGEFTYAKEPLEVSVVREGRRQSCHILGVYPDREQQSRKTTSIYNKTQNNTGKTLRSITMSASISSPTSMDIAAQPPVQVAPPVSPNIPKFEEIDKEQIMREAIALRKAKEEAESRLSAIMATNNQLTSDLENEKKLRRDVVSNEISAVLEMALAAMGSEKNEETVKALQPLLSCQDLPALTTAKHVMSGLISANSQAQAQVAQLQEQLKAARQQSIVSAYYSGTNNKFGAPETRFSAPLEVKIPQPQVQPQVQVQPQPQVQMQSQVNPQNQYSNQQWGQVFNPFVPKATAVVSANVNSQVPKNVNDMMSQQQQPKPFSIDQMPIFNMPAVSYSNDLRGAYGTIHESLSKRADQQRMNWS